MVISPKVRAAGFVLIELVFAAFGVAFQSERHPLIGALLGAGLGAVFLAVIWVVYMHPYEETHAYNEDLVKRIDNEQKARRIAEKERDEIQQRINALLAVPDVYVDHVWSDDDLASNAQPTIQVRVRNDGARLAVDVLVEVSVEIVEELSGSPSPLMDHRFKYEIPPNQSRIAVLPCPRKVKPLSQVFRVTGHVAHRNQQTPYCHQYRRDIQRFIKCDEDQGGGIFTPLPPVRIGARAVGFSSVSIAQTNLPDSGTEAPPSSSSAPERHQT